MDRIESINRQRLLWCCAEKGISAEELALDVGIAVSSLQRLLDDGVGLTFNQLKKVADFSAVGFCFFLIQNQ
jgi:DNA-binding Xre family transcriptional regulator